jgi:uncharacterized membrane protein
MYGAVSASSCGSKGVGTAVDVVFTGVVAGAGMSMPGLSGELKKISPIK